MIGTRLTQRQYANHVAKLITISGHNGDCEFGDALYILATDTMWNDIHYEKPTTADESSWEITWASRTRVTIVERRMTGEGLDKECKDWFLVPLDNRDH